MGNFFLVDEKCDHQCQVRFRFWKLLIVFFHPLFHTSGLLFHTFPYIDYIHVHMVPIYRIYRGVWYGLPCRIQALFQNCKNNKDLDRVMMFGMISNITCICSKNLRRSKHVYLDLDKCLLIPLAQKFWLLVMGTVWDSLARQTMQYNNKQADSNILDLHH